jgi:hypothetical protein
MDEGTNNSSLSVVVADENDATLEVSMRENGSNTSSSGIMDGSFSKDASKPWIYGYKGGRGSSTLNSTPPNNRKGKQEIVEFERQEGVVIATKLHGRVYLKMLKQSLCLLTAAYNNRLHYDILVFTTTATFNSSDIASLRSIVAPANLTIVVDNDGLQGEIAKLSPDRRTKFLKRCGGKPPENLTWFSDCPGRLAYNWQAEFRAWHIWKHPALEPYRYMMWMDTDGFCTKVWDRDPVAYMIRHELAIFFDNWPMGSARGKDIQDRIVDAFNTTLCRLTLENGQLNAWTGMPCPTALIRLIHGFFHITDLDFYRSDVVMHWAETLIGDCFLCRKYDDQVAVTIPAAILAPERAWDMRANGLHLDVFHNGQLDGKEKTRGGGFKKFWKWYGNETFPEAFDTCHVRSGG